MPEPLDFDVEYYDHIDGEIVGPMPFDNAEKMIALCEQRMTPENFEIFRNVVLARLAEERIRSH